MKVEFRQGVVYGQLDGQNNPNFLFTKPNGSVDVMVSTTALLLNFAQREGNYLVEIRSQIQNAWTGLDANIRSWLFFDIDVITGTLSQGFTTYLPVTSTTAPSHPAVGQHWFDLTKTAMKVWSGYSWIEVIHLVVGSVLAGIVEYSGFTYSAVGLNSAANAGYILYDIDRLPVRTSSGVMFTTDTDSYARFSSSESSVKFDQNVVVCKAGEPIAKYSLVYTSAPNSIKLAQVNATETYAIGICQSAAATGDTASVVFRGVLSHTDWSYVTDEMLQQFPDSSAGKSLYLSANGKFTFTRPTKIVAQKIGTVINASSIYLDIDTETLPFIVSGDTGIKGDKGDKGDTGNTGPSGSAGPAGHKGDKGDTGDTGSIGNTGPAGPAGGIGATGPKGDQGDPGTAGTAGTVGGIGPKGPQGTSGPQGAQGIQGVAGGVGPKGDIGDTGPAGPAGDKGDPGDDGGAGPAGAAGPQGTPGVIKYTYADYSPIAPSAGDRWFDTSNGLEFVYYVDEDSAQWVGVSGAVGPQGPQGIQGVTGVIAYTYSDTPPVSAIAGDRWFDTASGYEYVYYTDGDSNQWVSVSGAVGPQGSTGSQGPKGDTGEIAYTYSNTPPSSASAGDRWFDTDVGLEYVYLLDGDSNQWISVSGAVGPQGSQGPQGAKGDAGTDGSINYYYSDAQPTSANAGDRWFDTTSGSEYVYFVDVDSSQWISVSGSVNLVNGNSTSSIIINIPDVAIGTTTSVDLSTVNELFNKQSVIFFLINCRVTAPTNYSLLLVEKDSSDVETIVYQTAPQTVSAKDTLTFTFDRDVLANDLILKFQNSSSSLISGASVRVLVQAFD